MKLRFARLAAAVYFFTQIWLWKWNVRGRTDVWDAADPTAMGHLVGLGLVAANGDVLFDGDPVAPPIDLAAELST